MKSSFVLYTDYLKQTEMLSDEQMGVLFRSILKYVSGEEVEEMDPLTQMAFNFIKVKIDRDAEKYEEVCERRRAAGRKGGLAKASNAKQSKQNLASVADNENDNVNDNENDNVNDNENDNENDNDTNINVGKGNTPHKPPKTKSDQMIDAFKRHLPDHNFSPAMVQSIEDWCTYKIEKKQPYTETGVKKFLNEVEKQWKAHGEVAVIDIIDQSMASGYMGVCWERISKVKSVESTAERMRKVDEFI